MAEISSALMNLEIGPRTLMADFLNYCHFTKQILFTHCAFISCNFVSNISDYYNSAAHYDSIKKKSIFFITSFTLVKCSQWVEAYAMSHKCLSSLFTSDLLYISGSPSLFLLLVVVHSYLLSVPPLNATITTVNLNWKANSYSWQTLTPGLSI